MLVEDNASFRKAVRDDLLSRFSSLKVIEASNGEEALAAAASDPADLTFMDISLPGKNGVRITGEIKALRPDSIIIMLSGYDFADYRKASLQAGANSFIGKDSETLAAQILTVVSCLHGAKAVGRSRPGCLLI
jgi:DNA-binding NarL/FixJ family response regulator